ncbi:MAG TPA: hypothetical protein VMW27_28315 [Thermoanaerobaculia bacterium]|nr:hypothetical protein [Thermoanaerobaculia bacterium]
MSTTTQSTALTLESLETAATAAELVAPPFTSWSKFASPPSAGFWTAVGHDVPNGGIVMQLGAQRHPPTAPLTSGKLLAGYLRSMRLKPGYHTFTVRSEVLSVSRGLRGGGQLQTQIFLDILGPNAPRAQYQEVFGGGVCYLSLSVLVFLEATYTVIVGGRIDSLYQGSEDPYAEIIVRRNEVIHHRPAWVQSTSTAALAASEESFEPFDDKGLRIDEITPKELIHEPGAFPLRFDA